MRYGGILDVFLKVESTVFAEERNVDEREKEKSRKMPRFSA